MNNVGSVLFRWASILGFLPVTYVTSTADKTVFGALCVIISLLIVIAFGVLSIACKVTDND